MFLNQNTNEASLFVTTSWRGSANVSPITGQDSSYILRGEGASVVFLNIEPSTRGCWLDVRRKATLNHYDFSWRHKDFVTGFMNKLGISINDRVVSILLHTSMSASGLHGSLCPESQQYLLSLSSKHLPHAHSWRVPNHKWSSGTLNLWSSSVQKFPLFQRLGLPALARESVNKKAKIDQTLRTEKYSMLNASRSFEGKGFWRGFQDLSSVTQRRKTPLFLMLTSFSATLRVIVATIIKSTDWKTWTVANKLWWGVTYGRLGPGRSLETVPFLW